MPQVMEHVRQLADVIGPRPATTDAEARAADYIEGVFAARGLEVERQEFDCPRTRTWTYVACYAGTIAAAVLAGFAKGWLFWPVLALAVLAAVALWLELAGRAVVSRIVPKGPSQNVIARHVPRARRGERLRTVVIVAHYDSAKPSLLTSPSMVKNYPTVVGSIRWLAAAVPVLLLIGALPFAAQWGRWPWYAALVPAGLLALLLLVAVHGELFMSATDGANDNASGVAAMLAVMEATVPEVDIMAQRTQPIRRGRLAAEEADVVLEDAILDYQPTAAEAARGESETGQEAPLFEGFGDVGWETDPIDTTRTSSAAPTRAIGRGRSWADVDEDVDVSWDDTRERGGRWEDEETAGQGRLDLGDEDVALAEEEGQGQRRRKARDEGDARGVRDWLGIGRGFEVRKAGREIGSWDALADEDDEFGFKAGTAGEVHDESFAAEEAARIRRRVTESVDRALAEKEIWFVATGAKEPGAFGMRAFLDAYGDELDDAWIINIDTVGAGTTSFITDEGVTRRKSSDRRLASQARRTARENDLPIKGRSYRAVRTDAGLALLRGLKAMSVMAFDINDRLANWHWHTDTIERVQERTVVQATEFVTALLRDL